MAGHTWELERDLYLARYQGDAQLVVALEYEREQVQRACSHVENPERQGRCYKCGADIEVLRIKTSATLPGLTKTRASVAQPLKRVV